MARKVTEPSFEFWYDEKYYTVQGAKTILEVGTKDDIATMRAEYTRMRDVAQKRIKRLAKAYPESKTYKEHRKGFAKLRDIDPRDLPKAFSELAKFVRAKKSTVTGQRIAQQKTMQTINRSIGVKPKEETKEENGTQPPGQGEKVVQPLTKENYWRFIKILNEARELKKVYDSAKMAELSEATLELSDEQFDKVLDNLEKMIIHSHEVKFKISGYKVIHKGQDVEVDKFLEMTGW